MDRANKDADEILSPYRLLGTSGENIVVALFGSKLKKFCDDRSIFTP